MKKLNKYSDSLRLYHLFWILFISLQLITSCQTDEEDPWKQQEEIITSIIRPEFNDYQVNILDFGAKLDSSINSGEAIARAIEDCHASGGGTVVVPEGIYYTGPIHLKSNVNLHLEKGAMLKFSTQAKDYLPLVHTSWGGTELMNYSPLIYAYKQENIGITGEGTIDGQASYDNWWEWNERDREKWNSGRPYERDSTGTVRLFDLMRKGVPVEERVFGETAALRPHFIQLFDCKNILIDGLTVSRSPFWIIHPIYCTNITLEGLTIRSHGPNNDGIDPEYCKNVLIQDCLFDTGDDCIAIKSGRDEDGRRAGVPTENVIVRNCTMYDGHGGVVLGSETSAGVKNVFIENCIMSSPNLDKALRIKTNSKRGSIIENVFMRNVEVGQVKDAVFRFNMQYGTLESSDGIFTPSISNIYIEDIKVRNGGQYGIHVTALENSPVMNLFFKNIVIDTVGECYSMDFYEDIRLEEFYCAGEKIKL